MIQVADRINNLSESQTLAMARRSRELQQAGIDIISLSLGEPDFNTPDFVKEAANQAIADNFSHYTPVNGFQDLREALSVKFERDNQLAYSADEIVVSTGAKQSITNVMLSLVNAGDEVIVPAPYWVSYIEMIKMAEGAPVIVQSGIENDFKVTAAQIEAAITDKTKLMIFSTPCNPTGSVYSKNELESIAKMMEKHPNFHVICDEIYEHINFVGNHESLAQFDAIKDQVITVNGVSKGFAMTGWRIGYIGAPEWIAKACTKFQSNFTSGTNSVAQRACKAAVESDPESVKYMVETFAQRRDKMVSWMNEIPGFELDTPPGAFYVFPRVSQILGKKFKSKIMETSLDLSMYLLEQGLVSTVPGDAFGLPGYIRFSYAASESELQEAVIRVKNAVSLLED